MKKGKVAKNLSITADVAHTIEVHVATNRRKGCANVSELTERLWIGYLRRKGVKLPPSALFKENGKS